MNPLVLLLVAAVLAAASSVLIARAPRPEARGLALVAGGLLAAAAAIAALTFLGEPAPVSGAVAWLSFRFDAAGATLIPAAAFSGLALLLATPERDCDGPHCARVVGLMTAAALALLAADLRALVLAELASLSLARQALRALRRNALDEASFTLAAILNLAALAMAWFEGLDRAPFAELARSAPPLILVALGLAAALRLGLPPFSSWLSSALAREQVAGALIAALPFSGVAVFARVIEPALSLAGAHEPLVVSVPLLIAAVLLAAMAAAQRQLGRSYAYALLAAVCVSIVGVLDPDPVGYAGGLLMWAASLVATTGFGLAVAATTARLGPLDVSRHHGLYRRAPGLGLAFLVTGIALAGLPGSVDFSAAELMLHGSVSASAPELALIAIAFSLIGFNVIRLSFRVFFGPSEGQGDLDLRPRERVALYGLAAFLVLGGLAPGLIPLLRSQGG